MKIPKFNKNYRVCKKLNQKKMNRSNFLNCIFLKLNKIKEIKERS